MDDSKKRDRQKYYYESVHSSVDHLAGGGARTVYSFPPNHIPHKTQNMDFSDASNSSASATSLEGSVFQHFPTPPSCIRLAIVRQPQPRFRFRYASEMTGPHGCLLAESDCKKDKREFVCVKLLGIPAESHPGVHIRCSLVTNEEDARKCTPHANRLNPDANHGNFQEVEVTRSKNWMAEFPRIHIIQPLKKNVREIILNRLSEERQSKQAFPLSNLATTQLKHEADLLAKKMDLHSVRLKFEAFDSYCKELCRPIFSQPIYNEKSLQTSLKIVHVSKVAGRCIGGEEILIFVEKVDKKDIKVRFFEGHPTSTWEAFAEFTEFDVHHQYGIAFRTPPYKDVNINRDVAVEFQLYRPGNGSCSEGRPFVYIAQERISPGAKRSRLMEDDFESNIPTTVLQSTIQQCQSSNTTNETYSQSEPNSYPTHWDLSLEDLSALLPECFLESGFADVQAEVYDKRSSCDVKEEQGDQSSLSDGSPFINVQLIDNLDLFDNDEFETDGRAPLRKGRPISNDPATRRVSSSVDQVARRHSNRLARLMTLQRRDGNNILHAALVCDQLNTTRAILKVCSESLAELVSDFLNELNNAKQTPLHVATAKNLVEMVDLLLKCGADPTVTDGAGNTAVHLAVKDACTVETLQVLLSHCMRNGAIDKRDHEGRSPLHLAIIGAKSLERANLLLQHGADVNCYETKQGLTGLHLAVKNRDASLLDYLLRIGTIDVHRQSYDGRTALDLAVAAGCQPFVDALRKSGAADCDRRSGSSSDDNGTDETVASSDGEQRSKVADLEQTVADDCQGNSVLLKSLDESVLAKVSLILDPSGKWLELARNLDILDGMESVFRKQSSPTTYLLNNLDLWDVSVEDVICKLHNLGLVDAAALLQGSA